LEKGIKEWSLGEFRMEFGRRFGMDVSNGVWRIPNGI
jgi:hypothetical protein